MEEVDAGRSRIRNWFGDVSKRRGGQFHNFLPLPLPLPCPEVGVV